jgi:hypothetical protein
VSWARAPLRALLLALVAGVIAGIVATSASADADPASDVLYAQSVFYSFAQLPSAAAQKQLNEVVANAKDAGYEIRVALIAKPTDLGGVGALWAKPRQYARFLGLELTYTFKGPLLVVMPAGLGYNEPGKSPKAAYALLRSVRLGSGDDAQADAAVEAISRLAAAAGHPIKVPPRGSSSSDHTTRNRLIIALAGLVLAQVLVAIHLLRRRGAPSTEG